MNIIITGASKGIGHGIATHLASCGHTVGLIARSEDLLKETAEAIAKSGGTAVYAACDVSDSAAIRASIDGLAKEMNGIDALVNNAGIVNRKPIDELSDEEWIAMIDANVHGVFYTTRAVLPHLRDRGRGHIINVSSISGKTPLPGGSGYAATKFAVTGLSQSMFLELRNDDISVTTLYPGSVDSASHRHDPEADHSWKVQPEEVGQVCERILTMRPGALISDVEIRPLRKPK